MALKIPVFQFDWQPNSVPERIRINIAQTGLQIGCLYGFLSSVSSIFCYERNKQFLDIVGSFEYHPHRVEDYSLHAL